MSAEEFILIPKNMYVQQSPIVEQVLNNPQISSTGQQLSILQRFRPSSSAPEPEISEPIQPTKSMKETVIESLLPLSDIQSKRSSHIYDALLLNPKFSLDTNAQIEIGSKPTGLRIGSFLFNIQQPKKILDPTHKLILKELRLEEYLVANKAAKIISNKWVSFK